MGRNKKGDNLEPTPLGVVDTVLDQTLEERGFEVEEVPGDPGVIEPASSPEMKVGEISIPTLNFDVILRQRK